MTQFLISLDEVERVKRLHGIKYTSELAEKSDISRSTWTRALSTRKPSADILNALARLGARPNRVLIADDFQALSA